MKIIVFSDSHGKTGEMLRIVQEERAGLDMIIHLGDCVSDACEIADSVGLIPVCMVRGNCDPLICSPTEAEKCFELAGVRIFVCHGHSCGVKYNTDTLLALAKRENARLALYGHTHVARAQETDGVILFNPGSVSRPRSIYPASYGRIEINDGKVNAEIVYI